MTKFFFDFTKENITGRTTDKNKLGAKEKVLLRKTGFPIISTYDLSGVFPEQSLYFIFNNKTKNSLKYFTALINSDVFQFVYINKLVTNKDSTPQLKKTDLDKFPVFVCDIKKKEEKEKHDEIVKQVDLLLKLNDELTDATLQSKIEQISSRIDHCQDRINKYVFDLYNIDNDEIEVIQESIKRELKSKKK